LAALYEVETRVLNQSIKRNLKRFAKDFMFKLSKDEFESLRFQIDALEKHISSQNVMTYPNRRPNTALPYAFTEQGVAMLSGILNSDKAINMNIAIMRAFVEVRKIFLRKNDFKEQIMEIREKLGEHDIQLHQIYDALENLLDEKATERKWNERQRIGFRKQQTTGVVRKNLPELILLKPLFLLLLAAYQWRQQLLSIAPLF
jgi:hypothetical protein